MQRWVAVHNIEDFERRLEGEEDPVQREVLESLIEAERQRLPDAETDAPPLPVSPPAEA